jgi:hypothetical protein
MFILYLTRPTPRKDLMRSMRPKIENGNGWSKATLLQDF